MDLIVTLDEGTFQPQVTILLAASVFHYRILSIRRLAHIMHETPSRDRGDGRATGQPQGLGPEAYFISTSQGSRPEDARKDGHIRGRSRWFVHNVG
jgi:hypothetical protein